MRNARSLAAPAFARVGFPGTGAPAARRFTPFLLLAAAALLLLLPGTAAAAAPVVETLEAGPVQATGADLNGEVDAQGSPTVYWFEWGSADCSANPCSKTPVTPAGRNEVQQVVVNATAGQFTLTFEGQTTADIPFAAPSEAVQAALAALPNIGGGNVIVTGGRVPELNASRYRVRFIGDLGSVEVPNLVAADGSSPLTQNEGNEPGSIEVFTLLEGGYSGGPVYLTQHVSGLQPQTTYHFRIVAENGDGTVAGPDRQFTTAAAEPPCTNAGLPGTAFLPDCRAWELVSPPDKNGEIVKSNSTRTYVSQDGNGVVFPAANAFGDAVGGQVDTEYLSRRTGAAGTPGWHTHGITPPQRSLKLDSIGVQPFFQPLFTPDLSSGVFRSRRPLTDAPNVAYVPNLYRLDGLDGASPGVTLLSDSYAPIAPPSSPLIIPLLTPQTVGASTDLSHVIFESRLRLTKDAPLGLGNKIYEYADGQIRLASVLPDGTPAGGPSAGVGGPTSQYFPVPHAVSADGSHVFFSNSATGNIYVRINGTETIQLNASEREPPEEPQPAKLWEASVDGSRAFFTTSEGLVEGDEDGAKDLYMYDEMAPVGSRLTVLSLPGVETDQVLGASADGHYVYYNAEGVRIYLWHDGATTFVGKLGDGGDEKSNGTTGFFGLTSDITESRVSPDGRHLLVSTSGDSGFAGRGGFGGYDHGICISVGCWELYLYSAGSGRLQCASCNPSGTVATSSAHGFGVDAGYFLSPHLDQTLSRDGRYVFFNTDENLLPEDTNGVKDAYEFDSQTNSLHLLSSGTDPAPSYFIGASRDGRDAFITTNQRLVGWDPDNGRDVYDVRVDGGFPDPPPTAAPCQGDSCRPSPAPVPGTPPIGSAATRNGNINVPACRKRHSHRRRHCPRVKKHHKKHHHRTKHLNRRAGR
jgi:hypothetical protein